MTASSARKGSTSKVSQITSTEKQDLEVLGEITDASGAIVTKVKALWRVDKNKKGNKKPIKGGVTAENKQNKISFTRS
jgi:hypothetical protein